MKSPMLAVSYAGQELPGPMLASVKLDGVRALVINGVVLSRKFKPIPNKHVQARFGRKELNGLDGELIVGSPTDPNCFRNTMSGVMAVAGEPLVAFYAFDDFSDHMYHHPFKQRLESVFRRTNKHQGVLYVNHSTIRDTAQLELFEQAAINNGYEGVMLRHPEGPYKEGRSTVREGYLFKVKRFEDSEAVIMGFTELEENTNEKTMSTGGKMERSHKKEGMKGLDTLGAFLVQDMKTRVEFSVGSGFTQGERALYWLNKDDLLGKLITYKYFASGSKDKPRFPTFKGFRSKIDF
jgi:DNA ligase-1